MFQDLDLALRIEARELLEQLPVNPRLILMETFQNTAGVQVPLSQAYFTDFEEVLQILRECVSSMQKIPEGWR